MKTYMAKPGEVEAKWWLVDASDKIVGRLASDIAVLLMGKHRPTYTPHVDMGDFVVVVNAEKVVFTGAKWDKKQYTWYTGYTGQRSESARRRMERQPERILSEAVRRMLPKNKLGTKMLARVKLYAGDGTTVVERNDADYSLALMIDRGALEAGTYYLRVREDSGNVATGPYEIWVIDLGTDDRAGADHGVAGDLRTGFDDCAGVDPGHGRLALLVEAADHLIGDVDGLAGIQHSRRIARDDHGEALLLADLLDDPEELRAQRRLQSALVDLELTLELLDLVVDPVLQLGELHLLLEESLVREHELLALEFLLELLEASRQRLNLRLRLPLLAGELLPGGLSLLGGVHGLVHVDHPDLDGPVLRCRGRTQQGGQGVHVRDQRRSQLLQGRAGPLADLFGVVGAGTNQGHGRLSGVGAETRQMLGGLDPPAGILRAERGGQLWHVAGHQQNKKSAGKHGVGQGP